MDDEAIEISEEIEMDEETDEEIEIGEEIDKESEASEPMEEFLFEYFDSWEERQNIRNLLKREGFLGESSLHLKLCDYLNDWINPKISSNYLPMLLELLEKKHQKEIDDGEGFIDKFEEMEL